MFLNVAVLCGVLSMMEIGLKNQYGEILLATGTISKTATMNLYVDPIDRSWTILSITPSKMACVVNGGEKFETVRSKFGKDT